MKLTREKDGLEIEIGWWGGLAAVFIAGSIAEAFGYVFGCML